MSKFSEMWRNTSELGTDVLWQKVDILRAGIESGEPKAELLAECGKEGGDSKKQMERFYAVAKVFPPKEIADDFDYWTHEVCATAPGVDPDDRKTYSIAYGWQGVAIAGYDSKQGRKSIRRKHSARTLRALIRKQTASGKPKAEYIMRNQPAYLRLVEVMDTIPTNVVAPFASITRLTLDMEGEFDLHDLSGITVTITRQPQPETSNAADAEGSAAA